MNTDAIRTRLSARAAYEKSSKYVSSLLLPNGVPLALDNRSGDVWLLEPIPAWIAADRRRPAAKNSNLNGPWTRLGDPARASLVKIDDEADLARMIDHYAGADRADWFDLDPAAFDTMITKFRHHLPDFTGFEATTGGYYTSERRYKDLLIERWRTDVLHRLCAFREKRIPAEEALTGLHSALTTPLAADEPRQNLLGWRYVALIDALIQKAPTALADTLAALTDLPEEADAPEALASAFAALDEARSGADLPKDMAGLYSLLTLHSVLQNPTRRVFVRATLVADASKALVGGSLTQSYPVPAAEIRNIERFYRLVARRLADAGWPPRDMIDVHNFLWIGTGGWDAAAERPEDEPRADAHETDATAEVQVLPVAQIVETLDDRGLRYDPRTVARYVAGLATRRFVILAGDSGTGKTRLATTYAEIAGARHLVVPVAPNWTSNEDLLGFHSPLDDRYRDTEASRFLREAAAVWREAGSAAPAYHLVLDEMNLARVEYYFARLLSAMEARDERETFRLELAAGDVLELGPNLHVIGTVNVDETTHAFADKVYDRAQTIEIEATEEMIADALGDRPWKSLLLDLWRTGRGVAPFAFRTLDDVDRYVALRTAQGDRWEAAVDEMILQKILPKVKGGDPAAGDFLETCLRRLPDDFSLSRTRAERMLKRFRETGHGGFH